MKENIKVIAFDADDTLWVNETYFRDAEDHFAELLSGYETKNKIQQELFRIEIANLPLYGYGVKSFTLSMIQCALELSNQQLPAKIFKEILDIGNSMLEEPVILLPDIERVLKELSKKYKLIVATKGDLVDQERKLEKSGLIDYFHHVEVMSNKREEDYLKLIRHLDIAPESFLMIGNSMKSDILPLINIGSHAIHVPFKTTWEHEHVEVTEETKSSFTTLNSVSELLDLL